MRILALGDIVGTAARDCVCASLWNLRRELKLSLVIVNAENVCMGSGNGLDRESAQQLLQSGADVLTGGNHTFRRHNLYAYLEDTPGVLRPANFPDQAPGTGSVIVDADGAKVLVINVLGQMYLEAMRDPFDTVEAILQREKGRYDLAVLDIHAEATSEKAAIARYFDGRIAAIFGTHTHVQTADARVLGGGTGFLTDLGMCGPDDSILGVKTENILHKFRTKLPTLFEVAPGAITLHGAIFDLDVAGGVCRSVELFQKEMG